MARRPGQTVEGESAGRATAGDEHSRLRGHRDRGVPAFVAEFLGTFLLVFVITAAVTLYVKPPVPGPTGQVVQPFIDFSVIGLVHVFVLFILIQTLGVVSGAHFNPAITVALAAIRKISPGDAAVYIVLQLAGAVVAALAVKALLTDEGEALNYGAVKLSALISEKAFAGMVVELIGTFILVFTIMGVAIDPDGYEDWAGLAVGAALGLAVMVLAPLTGAGFNPARAFGPALVGESFDGAGDFLLAYVVGPLLGALLAAFLYKLLFLGGRDKPMEAVRDTAPRPGKKRPPGDADEGTGSVGARAPA